MVTSSGHIRKPEFTEDDFISGLETVLSKAWHPAWPLQISRVSQDAEHVLGYDGVLTSLVPFYIQFKVADFCEPQYSGELMRERQDLSLEASRGFFRLKLHKDKTTKKYDQHNALFALAEKQRAAYVAPLFYRAGSLTRFKQMAVSYPWAYYDLEIFDFGMERRFLTGSQREFARCMAIQPHRAVTDTEPSHYYTYDVSGQVCFHSDPERVEGGIYPLSNLLGYVTDDVFQVGQERFSQIRNILGLLPVLYGLSWESGEFASMVRATLLDIDINPPAESPSLQNWIEDLDSSQILLLMESMLFDDFNIVQFVAKPA